MLYQVNIRKCITGLLLLLFVFSSIPRKVLHDTFTHHLDGSSQNSKYASFEVQNSGLGCHCDDLYAQPVFDNTDFTFEVSPLKPVAQKHASVLPVIYSSEIISFGLRGPPAIA